MGCVEVTAADFRQHFELLSDEALLETNREELVEVARQCFDEEVSRRGLNAGDEAAAMAAETPVEAGNAVGDLVQVATFLSGDELNLARGLLEEASIPYHIVNPLAALGGIELRLMVPAALQEQALEILASEVSEEELAAQAEAAAMSETDAEEALSDHDD
jgi:hypothetical protein